jgi:hypothetical protein
MTLRELHSVLRLCDMWSFNDLRSVTIAQLELRFKDKTNAAWQYRIGKDHNVPGWVVPAITSLVCRPTTLTSDDIEALSSPIAARVIALRERNTRLSLNANSCPSQDMNFYLVYDSEFHLFQGELGLFLCQTYPLIPPRVRECMPSPHALFLK